MTGPSILRVGLCQLNPKVGDLVGNAEAIVGACRRVSAEGADVAVFPELALCGYPPDDLLLDSGFVSDTRAALTEVASQISGHCAAVLGWAERDGGGQGGNSAATGHLWNAAAVLHEGRMVGSYRKQVLGGGPLDDIRYFQPGEADQPTYVIGGVSVALRIGSELWDSGADPTTPAGAGTDLILNLGAWQFFVGESSLKEGRISTWARESGVSLVHVNLVGGQDEAVFDGGSLVVASDGTVTRRVARFETETAVIDVVLKSETTNSDSRTAIQVTTGGPETESGPGSGSRSRSEPPGPDPEDRPGIRSGDVDDDGVGETCAEIWAALTVGLRDYTLKNGFGHVGLGLSGGVDSSIVAALAVDALGSDRVHGVLMPSRYSSEHSVSDAEELADNLGIEHLTVPIEPAHEAFSRMLEASLSGLPSDLTDQNLQSRVRGMVLMALSNHFGWLILTTGNRSETAVGYSTLYGDTAGGFAAIADVSKTLVYELCRWRNVRHGRELIPGAVLTKAPSAELRPGQRDDQSLPPYEILDPLIDAHLSRNLGEAELVAEGFDSTLVEQVLKLIRSSEFKRRQEPVGVRLFRRGFGSDHRMPMTSGY